VIFDGPDPPTLWELLEIDPGATEHDFEFLIVGIGDHPAGGKYPRPAAVAGGPDIASDIIAKLDETEPEDYLGFPIYPLDYAGTA
jgi:hypothetical protein